MERLSTSTKIIMKFSLLAFTLSCMPCSSLGYLAPLNKQKQLSSFTKSNSLVQREKKYSTALTASNILDITTPKSTDEDNIEVDVNTVQTKVTKTYLDDGFVFGLDGSGLERPKGKDAMIVIENDSLETTPYQVGIVSVTLASHIAFLIHAFEQSLSYNHGDIGITTAASMTTIISSWLLADLGSGILHWSVDNYGNGKTPVMGTIIAAFQGHHTAQWTITKRGFFNNVYKLCVPFGIPTVALINLISSPQGKFANEKSDYFFLNFPLSFSLNLVVVVFECSIIIFHNLLHVGNSLSRIS